MVQGSSTAEAMRLKTTLASRIGSGTAMAGMMLFAVEGEAEAETVG